MSVANSRQNKKLRQLERALRKGRLPRFIDLVEWVKDRGHAQTTGGAVRLILADRVRYETHPLGTKVVTMLATKDVPEHKQRVLERRVPAGLRTGIHVIPPEGGDPDYQTMQDTSSTHSSTCSDSSTGSSKDVLPAPSRVPHAPVRETRRQALQPASGSPEA